MNSAWIAIFQGQYDSNTENSQRFASQSILQDWASTDSSSSTTGMTTSCPTRTSSVSLGFKQPIQMKKTKTIASSSSTSSSLSNPFSEFSGDEGEFIQLLINAKTVADMNETEVPVEWRGYGTSVMPNLPPFTKTTLRERLNSALQNIQVKRNYLYLI